MHANSCNHPMHDDDCPHGCAAPAPVCEYCGKPEWDKRTNRRNGRIESVCEDCYRDLDSGDEIERREQAYEDAVDRSLSEWKDGGKVGWPRPVGRMR